MFYSSYDPGSRYRRRTNERRRRMMMVLIFLMAVCGASYWLGGETVKSSEFAYKHQYSQIKTENATLEQKLTELLASNQSLQRNFSQLETTFSEEVPTGALKTLTELAAQQLKNGISEKRLAFVIRSAQPPRNCTSPQSKRFVIRTKNYTGPDSSVSFVKRSVSVTGVGEPATSPDGNVQAWFDAGKEVKIKFAQLGGTDVVKTGLLPIHHAMVIGDKEHRFTISKGSRSFVNVTSDSCDYP